MGGAEGATPKLAYWGAERTGAEGARRGATKYAYKGTWICHLVLRIGYFDRREKWESKKHIKKCVLGGFRIVAASLLRISPPNLAHVFFGRKSRARANKKLKKLNRKKSTGLFIFQNSDFSKRDKKNSDVAILKNSTAFDAGCPRPHFEPLKSLKIWFLNFL